MKEIYLTDTQFLKAIKNIRQTIATTELDAFDSTAPGNKDTQCNWGTCGDIKAHWPDPDMHLWPDEFIKRGRVAPRYKREDEANTQTCPMRQRNEDDSESVQISGCFYQCRVFQRKLKTPTREEALKLYDAKIAAMESSQ